MNWVFLGAFCLVVSTLLIFRKELLNFYRIYSARSMNPEDMTKHGLEFLKGILGDISKSNPMIESGFTSGSKSSIPLPFIDHPFIKKVKKEVKNKEESEEGNNEVSDEGETNSMKGAGNMINELFGSLKGLMEPQKQKTVLTKDEEEVIEFLEKRYNRKVTLLVDSEEFSSPILGGRPVPDGLQLFKIPWKTVEDDEDDEEEDESNESNESDGKRNDRIGGKVNDDEGIVFAIWKDDTLHFGGIREVLKTVDKHFIDHMSFTRDGLIKECGWECVHAFQMVDEYFSCYTMVEHVSSTCLRNEIQFVLFHDKTPYDEIVSYNENLSSKKDVSILYKMEDIMKSKLEPSLGFLYRKNKVYDGLGFGKKDKKRDERKDVKKDKKVSFEKEVSKPSVKSTENSKPLLIEEDLGSLIGVGAKSRRSKSKKAE